jgi:hypothetical protein
MDDDRLDWHSAFYDAIRLELEPYLDALEFVFEHELTTKPLRIDALIIKKIKDVVIQKNIALIFRVYNILEFKSPEAHFGINDFHRAMAYTHLYCAINTINIRDVSLTFVVTKHPREVIKHLEQDCHFTVRQRDPGIYIVEGALFPIQIIETKLLSEDDNLWLKDLSNDLDVAGLSRVLDESMSKTKIEYIKAYMHVLLRANMNVVEEVKMVSTKDFYAELERIGVAAHFEQRGIQLGMQALDLIEKGYSVQQAREMLQQDQSAAHR